MAGRAAIAWRVLLAVGWLLLCLATARLAIQRFAADPAVDGLHHDEAIALLAITGHEEDLKPLVPGRVVPLASIQATHELDSERGPIAVARGLIRTDFHPPLYFWLGHAWLHLGGALGVPVRSHDDAVAVDVWLTKMSGLMVLLAVGLLLYEGLRRRDRAGLACLGAAALVTASPYVVWQARNCRPYALVILLAVAGWLLLLRIIAEDGRRQRGRLVLLGLVLGCGLLTHYLFAFCALPMLLALLPGRAGAKRAALAGGVAGLMFAPWLIAAGGRVLKPPAHLRRSAGGLEASIERLDTLLRGYFEVRPELEASLDWPVWALPLLVGLVCLALLISGRRYGRATALVVLLPLALPLAVDLGLDKRLLSVDRVAVAFVPLVIWAAAWLVLGLGRRAGPALLLLAAAFALQFGPLPSTLEPNRYVRGGARLAQELAEDPAARALVVTTTDARGQLLQRVHYLPQQADLVLIEAKRLRHRVPFQARGYSLVYVLGARHAKGRPNFKRRDSRRLDKRMTEAGFERIAQARWRKDGWALYRRASR